MQIDIPTNIVQEAIDADVIQSAWSVWWIEARSRAVQMIEHHIGEIVSAIIIKEYRSRQKNPKLK